MITEPEMVEEPEPDRPAPDILSGAGHAPPSLRSALSRLRTRLPPPRSPADPYRVRDTGGGHGGEDRGPTLKPWRPRPEGRRGRVLWALGGVVTASAVWLAVLQFTGYGGPRPDLHGYHLADNPCTSDNLQPLSDAFGTEFLQGIPVITKGPALDHAACTLTTSVTGSGDWETTYTVTVTVDLHKKSDVHAEFADLSHVIVPDPTTAGSGDFLFMTDSPEVTKALRGLGDQAFTIYGTARQAVTVRHGGAVFSLSVDGIQQWNGVAARPLNADGSPIEATPADTIALRPALIRAMRHLMSALTH
ncbi:hypothetical protein ACIOC1_13830 [Streptomyces sp. NPDC088197]|uniref:hypothetical protein n=1 Tax=Streptomyces sp. NPDC088197 TaxID=3365840 RepID=UPI00381C146E